MQVESKQDATGWTAGLAVTHLESATHFFREYMDMEVAATSAHGKRHETVLQSKSNQGARIVLSRLHAVYGPLDVPAKLVFLVHNIEGRYARLRAAGYSSSCPPTRIGGGSEMVAQIEGPDGYIIEMSQSSTEHSSFVALCLSVSDPFVTEAFFTRFTGMQRARYVSKRMIAGKLELQHEVLLQHPARRGASIGLASSTSFGHRYKYKRVKLVHDVYDMPALLAKSRLFGIATSRRIDRTPEHGARAIARLRDPDGYALDFVEASETAYVDHPVLKLL